MKLLNVSVLIALLKKMTTFKYGEMMDDIREDSLLIGDYKVYQNKNAYCFTSDSVRLSKFVNCKNSGKILELCAGCGIISLHKFAENEQKGDSGRGSFVLVELQQILYELLKKNIEANNLQDVFYAINDDLKNIFNYIEKASMDVVICNPPYEKDCSGFKKQNESEMIARAEITTNFDEIAKVAGLALKFGGQFYFLCKSERLFEIANTLSKYDLKIKTVQFVTGGKRWRLCLVKAVKGAKDGVEFSVYKEC